MRIDQLSIFVENKTGRLHTIIDTLGAKGINLRALSIADTTDFGILRLIVSDVYLAKDALSEIGVISKITEVIAVMIEDKTGGLASVLDSVSDAGLAIEYMYAFIAKESGKAMMVLKTDDDEAAEQILTKKGIRLADKTSV